MNTKKIAGVLCFLALCLPGMTFAQNSPARHPLLEDTFTAGLGAFVFNRDFTLRVDGESSNLEVDFDEAANLSSDDATFSATLRWRFGEKWSLWSQYFYSEDTKRAELTEDVPWRDVVFRQGTFVEAGLDISVVRLFMGRIFNAGPKHEFGAGAGLHWLEIGASIAGEALINDQSTGFYSDDVDAGAPLPNIGAWYLYTPTPRWAIETRLDWLEASFDEYSGGLWNASVGAQYQAFEHFGVGLSYQFFRLNVDVDNDHWDGATELTFQGPFLSVTATW